MKGRILSLLLFATGVNYISAQVCKDSFCIDTVDKGLTLLSKIKTNTPDCIFTIEFCLRKINLDVDSIDYSIYHTNGATFESISVSGIPVGSVICKTFSFQAHCNSSASVFVVSREINNSICGILSDLIILPIRLLSFSGDMQKSGLVNLKWQTASESNSSHFIIQQSRDGKNFLDISKVKAAGESTALVTYSYEVIPNSVTSAALNSYYRLKLVDRDERFTYSQVIKVGKSITNKIEVYPNPSSHLLKVNIADLQKKFVKIVNIQGQEISFEWSDENTLDISNFNSGVYWMKYQDEVIRIIKE